jgi:hypothetical protein
VVDGGACVSDPRGSSDLPALGRKEAVVYRRPVDSTLIRSVGYDLSSSVLEVEFVAGDVYEYYDVPLSIYSALMEAGSKGAYFNDHVRDMYPYAKVD